MTDESSLKRVNLRMSAEDVAWLTEQAEDEGVEYTTLIRMIVNRLRRGRPPLVSMMTPAVPSRILMRGPQEPRGTYPTSLTAEPIDAGLAEDVLQTRLQELETMPADQPSLADDAEVVAIPLRRVGREQYNPGRR